MYIKDTAFKYKQHVIYLTKTMLNNIASSNTKHIGVYTPPKNKNPYKIDNPYSGGEEDISWLL